MADIKTSKTEYVERFNGNRQVRHLFISAFIINMIFLMLCLIFLDVKYEVSDDYIVDSVMSGAFSEKGFGSYDAHLLFSNVFLGYPLKLLYMLIPTVSWYFVFLMMIAFVSLTVVTYMVLAMIDHIMIISVTSSETRKRNYMGIATGIIFLIYYSVDLYTLVQFTKIGAAAVISGGSLFLYLLWNRNVNHRVFAFAVAVLLTMTGIFLRPNIIGVTMPFLLLQFVFYVYQGNTIVDDHGQGIDAHKEVTHDDNDASQSDTASQGSGYTSASHKWRYIKSCFIRFSLCTILVGAVLVLNRIGEKVFDSREDYQNYRYYSGLRSRVTDTEKYGYDDVEDAFKIIGFDEIDYYMISSWNFCDRTIYSDDYLEYLSSAFKEKSGEKTHSLEYVIEQMIKRDYTSYNIFIGLIIILILTMVVSIRFPIWHVGTLVMTIFLLGLFFWSGRVVYRVEFGIIYSAAVTALVCGLYSHNYTDTVIVNGSDINGKSIFHSSQICLFVMFIVIITNILLFVPDRNYKTMTDQEYQNYVKSTLYPSGDYISGKYRMSINSRRPYDKLIDYIESDIENYYLLDFSSCIQLIYFDYKPWVRMPQGYFDENYAYLGGVTMQFPAERELFERHGLDPDCPYKDIVKDGIYIVDNKYYEIKLKYLQKYYYPNARKELVDTIDGFMIWKYYEE